MEVQGQDKEAATLLADAARDNTWDNEPINAALDFVIKKGLQLAVPVIRGLKGVGSNVKAKVASGEGLGERQGAERQGSPRPAVHEVFRG